MEDEMRTTLDIEDDVLAAAKEIAHKRGQSTGKVLSDLVRQTLSRHDAVTMKNGVPLFPVQPGARIVTSELVYQLQEDEVP
jgi:hypothetical protein